MIVTAVIASMAPERLPVIIAAFWTVDGLLVLSSAAHSPWPEERSELLVFAGVASIILGLLLPVLLDTGSLSFVAAIATWGLTMGLLTAAAVLNTDIPEVRPLLGVSAAISCLLGLITACSAPSDPIAIRWILAHAIAQGYLMVALAGKLKLENESSRS